MPKSRLSAAISLLLVFMSGALVGVLGHRAYLVNQAQIRPPRPSPEDFRKRYVQDFKTAMQLDDGQVVKLEQILDETGAKVRQNWMNYDQANDAVRNEQVERINEMLRPEQRPLYEKFRAERDAKMRKDGKRGRGPGGRGGPPPPR